MYRMIFLTISLILAQLANLSAQNMDNTTLKATCDPVTGLCIPADISGELPTIDYVDHQEIIYIGDPMCSWCWGISPQLNALRGKGATEGIPFRIVMGGLRPGGGEEWNTAFKNFLKHHWEDVNKKSGQPFGYALFDQEDFNYDTEPACRAVVTVRHLAPLKALEFYEHVQHHFYVQSKDPGKVEFYRPICEKLAIDFAEFSQAFVSSEMKTATKQDFMLSQQWGIRGFPSVVFRNGEQLNLIASGYAEVTEMWERIEEIRK